MPLYLSRFSYTPETWARLVGTPEDRRKAAQSYIESVGGKLHGFWYAFGTHDGYNLWEAPDNVSMAAVAMAISGGGSLMKTGTGTLSLTNANTYTGTTTINQGTLALSGGNTRLPVGTTLAFTGSGTLDVGSTSQTIAQMTFPNTTMTATIAVRIPIHFVSCRGLRGRRASSMFGARGDLRSWLVRFVGFLESSAATQARHGADALGRLGLGA